MIENTKISTLLARFTLVRRVDYSLSTSLKYLKLKLTINDNMH